MLLLRSTPLPRPDDAALLQINHRVRQHIARIARSRGAPLVTAAIELLGAELRDVKLSAEAES